MCGSSRLLARTLACACALVAALVMATTASAIEFGEPSMGTGLAEHDTMGTTQLATGGDSVIAIRSTGTTMAWGANAQGQLGDTTLVDRTLPTTISTFGLTGYRVAMGANFGVAIRLDGTVWTWGDNTYGQLGHGDTTQRSTPTQVTGLPIGASQVFAGDHHAMAILADGTVYAWGRNNDGQLGDGSTLPRTSPVPIAGLLNARSLALGARHSLAILANGNVMSWGANASGQLGIGSTTPATTPQLVTTATTTTGARQIAAGGDHSLMVMMNGDVRSWGENEHGQVGASAPTDQTSPVTIAGAAGARAVTAGSEFSAVILPGGGIATWGDNASGQLGLGDLVDRTTPTTVAGTGDVIHLAAGRAHLAIVEAGGTIRVTGANQGQVGDGTTRTRLTPHVSNFTWGFGFKHVDTGDTHSLAVRADGSVWTWGNGLNGMTGLGSTTDRDVPTKVTIPGNLPVRMAEAGYHNSLAVTGDGDLYIWGDDSSGQIGNGTGVTADQYTPVLVPMPCKVRVAMLVADAVVAICTNGLAYSWGDNIGGALGIGSTTDRDDPLTAPNLNYYRQIASRYGPFSYAVRANGTTVAWGDNGSYRLGDGTTTDRTAPVTISATGSRQLAAGGLGGGVSRGSGGVMRTWGYNGSYLLGNGGSSNETTPWIQAGGANSRAVTAGATHMLVVNADGTATGWGRNLDGEVGTGATGNLASPVSVAAWSNRRMISAGGYHTIGIATNGTLLGVGRNSSGQLGDNTSTSRLPVVTSTNPAPPPDTTPPVPRPVSGDAVATSTTSITWTLDQGYDETAMHATLPYSIDTGAASWQATTTRTYAGLSPNTLVPRTVRIRDAALNVSTSTLSAWTWAGVPVSPSGTPSWTLSDGNRVALSWSAPVGGASSYVIRSSLDGYATVLDTPAGLASVITGLAADTPITYRICAVNGGGTETPAAGCASVSVRTPPGPPTAVAIGSVTDTGFSVSWTAPVGATSQEVTTYSNAACTVPVDTDATSSPFAQTGLSPDRIYRVTVRAFSTTSGAWGAPSACTAPPGIARTSLTVSAPASVNMGSASPGNPVTGSSTISVSSYAATAFDLQAFKSAPPTNGGYTIGDTTPGTLATPGAWTGTGFGFTISSAPGLLAKWGAGANYAPMPDAPTVIYARTGMTTNTATTTNVDVGYRLVAGPTQAVGTYTTTITYVAVATT